VGWEKVACWSTKAAISLKRVKIEKSYCEGPIGSRRHISTSGFASTATETAVFCLIFARTAQQLVLDGTNGLSSFKSCAYCRIVHRADIFAIARLSC